MSGISHPAHASVVPSSDLSNAHTSSSAHQLV